MLLVLLTLYSTNMTDTNTQEFSKNEPTQQSSYTAYEQLEDMSPSLVTVLEFWNQTCDEHQYMNESVTVENVSVT